MASIEGAGGLNIIITGASSGLGEAMAHVLAGKGHRLVLVARRADLLSRLAAAINPSGKRVIAAPADVSEPGALARVVERAESIFGAVGAVVNNAGIGEPDGPYWKADPDQIRQVMTVNLTAAMELTRLVLPRMIERNTGHVINVGSVAGRTPSSTVYSASKFGLRGFTLSLRRELLGTNVSASLVTPGFIRTPMTENVRGVPMPGPEVVANAVARLLEHPRAEVVVPGWYRTLIALDALFPGLGDAAVRRYRRP
ncbi:MAG TPA: SDR family NAD(P)-dependent oxidoreductase [Deinococcales bacterium]|nr:SDR family NAD(P)-dependent oxidoreductase [Deinococcales bacterium]